MVALNLCMLVTSVISLGVMQKLALAVVGFEKLFSYDVADDSMHSRSLCCSLRSDEKSRSWHLGRVGSWNLLGLLLAAWTLGASGELLEAALGLQNRL